MNFLFSGDWHLTSRPQDDYRWSLFPFLHKQIEHRKIGCLFCLGDITDRKDDHPSALVNRLVDELRKLPCDLVILKGNHDYVDSANPFFRFLAHLIVQGDYSREFIADPRQLSCGGQKLLLLPHTRKFRQVVNDYDLSQYDKVLIHQPVGGAKAENGQRVEGIHPRCLKKAKAVIAGDIHVPQTIGNLTYVGAPHPLHYGDHFQPRVLAEIDGNMKSISRTTIKKLMVNLSDPEELLRQGLTDGDMVNVTVHLRREDMHEWDRIRNRIVKLSAAMGVHLVGPKLAEIEVRARGRGPASAQSADPAQLLRRYGKAKNIADELMEVGVELLGDNNENGE